MTIKNCGNCAHSNVFAEPSYMAYCSKKKKYVFKSMQNEPCHLVYSGQDVNDLFKTFGFGDNNASK